ncbi:AAA family ATPase [Escherichia coli]|nr:AAA family ATPase [Escherichia coli]
MQRQRCLRDRDEVVEARQDTVVVLHPLTDHRRILPIDKTGEVVEAAPGFGLIVSYNPCL